MIDDCFMPHCVGWKLGIEHPEFALWSGAVLIVLLVISAVMEGEGWD